MQHANELSTNVRYEEDEGLNLQYTRSRTLEKKHIHSIMTCKCSPYLSNVKNQFNLAAIFSFSNSIKIVVSLGHLREKKNV